MANVYFSNHQIESLLKQILQELEAINRGIDFIASQYIEEDEEGRCLHPKDKLQDISTMGSAPWSRVQCEECNAVLTASGE